MFSAPSRIQGIASLRPGLGIRRSGSALELQWPAAIQGFQLETASGLADPTLWVPVPIAPVTRGEEQVVPILIDDATRLYRLRQR